MSTGYNRLKKYRQLKTPAVEFTTSSESLNNNSQVESQNDEASIDVPMEINVIHNYSRSHESANRNNTCTNYNYGSNNDDNLSDMSYSSFEDGIRSPDDTYQSSHESSTSDFISVQESDCNDTVILPNLCQKLQEWAVKFRSNLTVETIENLLEILKDEQLPDIPKSAASLLETKSNRNVTDTESLKNTNGYYVYFGIKDCLKWVITEEYDEDVIRLLFNIDRLPLYNNSSQQFWPILALILHNEYESQPIIVAVYSGDSKPKNVEDYLKDLLGLLATLQQDRLSKKCKGLGSFYACERCETRRKTKNRKRVYPKGSSPLLSILNFDPVKSVFLDSMHLLYLGITKWLLQHYIESKKRVNPMCKLPRHAIEKLNLNLNKSAKVVVIWGFWLHFSRGNEKSLMGSGPLV
ncbi:Dimer Tnp hAT domain-containing protein, partial [Aphis craccivora]